MTGNSPSDERLPCGAEKSDPCAFYDMRSCMCAHIEDGGYVKYFGIPPTKEPDEQDKNSS